MKEIRFLPTSVEFYDQTKISRPTYMRGVGFMAEQRGTGGEGGVFPLPLAVRGVKLLHFYEGEYIHPIERGDFFLPTVGVIFYLQEG